MRLKHKSLFLCAIVLMLMSLWKIEAISSRIIRAKKYLRTEYIISKMHRPLLEISNLKALTSYGDEWFCKYRLIAHNGGIIQGRTNSDSREAWELSYSRSIRIIDANLCFTADNHLVLRHSWSDDLEQSYFPAQPTLQDFTSKLIFMKYTPMTAEDMIIFMMYHSDLYVAADSKDDPAKIYSAIVQTARSMNAEEVLSRIIVSLDSTEDITRVKSVYPFSNFVLRQYGWSYNWYSLASFCVKNDIHVVNVSGSVIDADPEGIKLLTSKGIHVYAAVVNSLRQLQKYKNLGISGAVSDYLNEADWELLE